MLVIRLHNEMNCRFSVLKKCVTKRQVVSKLDKKFRSDR